MNINDLNKFDGIEVCWFDSRSFPEWEQMDEVQRIALMEENMIITYGHYSGQSKYYISVSQNRDSRNTVASHVMKILKKSIQTIERLTTEGE